MNTHVLELIGMLIGGSALSTFLYAKIERRIRMASARKTEAEAQKVKEEAESTTISNCHEAIKVYEKVAEYTQCQLQHFLQTLQENQKLIDTLTEEIDKLKIHNGILHQLIKELTTDNIHETKRKAQELKNK